MATTQPNSQGGRGHQRAGRGGQPWHDAQVLGERQSSPSEGVSRWRPRGSRGVVLSNRILSKEKGHVLPGQAAGPSVRGRVPLHSVTGVSGTETVNDGTRRAGTLDPREAELTSALAHLRNGAQRQSAAGACVPSPQRARSAGCLSARFPGEPLQLGPPLSLCPLTSPSLITS